MNLNNVINVHKFTHIIKMTMATPTHESPLGLAYLAWLRKHNMHPWKLTGGESSRLQSNSHENGKSTICRRPEVAAWHMRLWNLQHGLLKLYSCNVVSTNLCAVIPTSQAPRTNPRERVSDNLWNSKLVWVYVTLMIPKVEVLRQS